MVGRKANTESSRIAKAIDAMDVSGFTMKELARTLKCSHVSVSVWTHRLHKKCKNGYHRGPQFSIEGVDFSQPTDQVAKRIGCTHETVYRYRRALGFPVPKVKPGLGCRSLMRRKMLEMDTTSMTIPEIMAEVGCTRIHAYVFLNSANKPFRRLWRGRPTWDDRRLDVPGEKEAGRG